MSHLPSITAVQPSRPTSPPASALTSKASREKTHFSNTLRQFNKQLRQMDVPQRMISQDAFHSALEKALDRLWPNLKNPEKSLVVLFVTFSGETPKKKSDPHRIGQR